METVRAERWIRRHKGFEPSGLATWRDGSLLVVGDEGQLARLEPGAKRLEIHEVSPRTDLEGVTVDAQGRLLVLAESRNQLWQVRGGRRVEAWRLEPAGTKRDGYEGLTALQDGRLVLSTQGKRAALRVFAPLQLGAGVARMVSEQRLDVPDVAGLAVDGDALLALSDKGRTLLRLERDGLAYVPTRSWKTPTRDLEGVVVLGEHLILAQDSGGLWRGPWPQ